MRQIECYCLKLLIIHPSNRTEFNHKSLDFYYNLVLFTILEDVMYAQVSFKRSRPTPLIFDSALELSRQLQIYFTELGEKHDKKWNVNEKNVKYSCALNYKQQLI